MAATLGQWEATLVKQRKDIINTTKAIASSEQTLSTLIGSQCGAVASNLSQFSQKIAVQLSQHGTSLERAERATAEQFVIAAARSARLEDRLNALDSDNRLRDARMERAQLVQADLLARVERLEIFQKHSIAKFDKVCPGPDPMLCPLFAPS